MERTLVAGKPDSLPPSTYLWIAPLVAPAVWFLDLQVSYVLVHWTCVHKTTYLLHLTSLVALAIVAGTGVWGWRRYRAAGPAGDRAGEGLPATRRPEVESEIVRDIDWRPFLLLLTAGTGLMFALVVAANALPRFVIDPCVR